MDWTKVVTEPLGLAGYALAAFFTLVRQVIAKKRGKEAPWLVPASYVLVVVCIVGGLVLAYRHESKLAAPSKTTISNSPNTSIQTGSIDQKVGNGSAVVGVQGNVTVNPPVLEKESKPQQKAQ